MKLNKKVVEINIKVKMDQFSILIMLLISAQLWRCDKVFYDGLKKSMCTVDYEILSCISEEYNKDVIVS